MPFITELSIPLNDDELDRLDDFLYNHNPEDAMSTAEMDGFFCALICGPESIPPSEYLPYVYGSRHSSGIGFKNLEEAQEIMTLITRHWNTVASALSQDLLYPGMMDSYEDGKMAGQQWAMGFGQGIDLREEGWKKLMKDKFAGMALFPIFALVENDELQSVSSRAKGETREDILDMVPISLFTIYHFFRDGLMSPVKAVKKPKPSKKK